MCGRSAVLMLTLTLAFANAASMAHAQTRAAKTLDIYYIDVEGRQTTLFVSPSGESRLVDTGFPGERDAGRITLSRTRETVSVNRIRRGIEHRASDEDAYRVVQ